MRKIQSLMAVALCGMCIACGPNHKGQVMGNVINATSNSLRIVNERGDTLSFSTMNAKMEGVDASGLMNGMPVDVAYTGDAHKGKAEATMISLPPQFKMLVGTWISTSSKDKLENIGKLATAMKEGQKVQLPMSPDMSVMSMMPMCLQLNADCSAMSYNMDGDFTMWKLISPKKLYLKCMKNVNGKMVDASGDWEIEKLNDSMLVIKNKSMMINLEKGMWSINDMKSVVEQSMTPAPTTPPTKATSTKAATPAAKPATGDKAPAPMKK